MVVVPDVVEQLLPGDNKAITWTATVQEDKESIDWVCTERTLVKKVMSKL